MEEEREGRENWKHWTIAIMLILLPAIITYIVNLQGKAW